MVSSVRQPVIGIYVRSPLGLAKRGSLGTVNPVYVGGPVFREVVNRSGLNLNLIKSALVGSATQTGPQGVNISRRVLKEAYGAEATDIFSSTLNTSCASSLEAIVLAAQMIKSGEDDFVLVGGVESNSEKQAPAGSDILLPQTSLGNMMKVLGLGVKFGSNPGRLESELLKLTMPADQPFVGMNMSGDYIAQLYGYKRPDLEEIGARSITRATVAQHEGKFDDEIVPINLPRGKGWVRRDETIRMTSTLLAQGKLKTTLRGGFHHAGTSSQLGVGASALVVCDEEAALKHGIIPIARIKAWGKSGTDPTMGQLLGPLVAVRRALVNAGLLRPEDINNDRAVLKAASKIDYWEANEAFASEEKVVREHFGINEKQINIKGGAIAVSHPFAVTGGRIAGVVANQIRDLGLADTKSDRPPKLGIATLCIAQGLGEAVVFEEYRAESAARNFGRVLAS